MSFFFRRLNADEGSAVTAEASTVVFIVIGLLLIGMSELHPARWKAAFAGVAVPASDSTFLERHFSIAELADTWRYGRETIRLAVKDEPGVLKIRHGRNKAHTRYSVPESVAKRVYRRPQNGGKDS
jgi:hypothetical protein